MQNRQNSVPHPGWERFEEAVAGVEAAMKTGDDDKTREAIIALGQVAWNAAHGISAALRHTARTSPRLTVE